MSGITPEEDAGYTRFTAVLPTDIVKKLDVLKAYASLDNRNRVISDAVETLFGIASDLAFLGTLANQNEREQVKGAMVIDLVTKADKYWLPMKELIERKKPNT